MIRYSLPLPRAPTARGPHVEAHPESARASVSAAAQAYRTAKRRMSTRMSTHVPPLPGELPREAMQRRRPHHMSMKNMNGQKALPAAPSMKHITAEKVAARAADKAKEQPAAGGGRRRGGRQSLGKRLGRCTPPTAGAALSEAQDEPTGSVPLPTAGAAHETIFSV